MTTAFRDFTIRPNEHAQVFPQADGSVMIVFEKGGLTVILSPEEAQRMAGAVQSALAVGDVK